MASTHMVNLGLDGGVYGPQEKGVALKVVEERPGRNKPVIPHT